MELDDFKQTWKQATNKPPQNYDIMEMIRKKSASPVASLKRAFSKQIRLVIVVMTAITFTNGRNLDNAAAIILFSTYLAFCIGLVVFFFINYRRTALMERMDGDLKTHLSSYVSNMEKRLNDQYIAVRLVALLFIVLLETLPYFSHSRMLDKFHSLNVFARIGIYVLFFLFQYTIAKMVRQRKFGRYLARLKSMLEDLS